MKSQWLGTTPSVESRCEFRTAVIGVTPPFTCRPVGYKILVGWFTGFYTLVQKRNCDSSLAGSMGLPPSAGRIAVEVDFVTIPCMCMHLLARMRGGRSVQVFVRLFVCLSVCWFLPRAIHLVMENSRFPRRCYSQVWFLSACTMLITNC